MGYLEGIYVDSKFRKQGVADSPMQKAEPITENMFTAKSIAELFSTHPPTKERIKGLKKNE